MSFTLNTNTYGLYAHARTSQINDRLGDSLEKLSSGLRINSAADDASGLAIANNLKMQSSSLNQSMKNANEAIGLSQIADNAMDEMSNILNTIKTKAIQSAQDGQSSTTRAALQKDISKLMESYEQIVNYTEYNGQKLLAGNFMGKDFQVGATSNQTVTLNIQNVGANSIGQTRFETINSGNAVADAAYTATTGTTDTFTLTGAGKGGADLVVNYIMGNQQGQGVGMLANEINKYSDITGVKASWTNRVVGTDPITASTGTAVDINGVSLGTISWEANDSTGSLIAAINSKTSQTGVVASTTEDGKLVLDSVDGRAIEYTGLNAEAKFPTDTTADTGYIGSLTLVGKNGNDIDGVGTTFFTAAADEITLNLSQIVNGFNATEANAAGIDNNIAGFDLVTEDYLGTGSDTGLGAQMVMDIVENAMTGLDAVRSDIGSVQNQLTSQINNITITQANIKTAESGIRDVDFAAESAEFNKNKLLAQAGTFAMSQASSIEQNVMKLLQ
jgi:flagellin